MSERGDPFLEIERAAESLLDQAAYVFTHASEDRDNLSYVGEMRARVQDVRASCDTILHNLYRLAVRP